MRGSVAPTRDGPVGSRKGVRLLGLGLDDPWRDVSELLRHIHRRWPTDDEPPSAELMTLVEHAVEKCPHVSAFWMVRAQLIQLFPEGPYTAEDVRLSLEAATRVDPGYTDAHMALASFNEEVLDDLDRAHAAYLAALDSGAGTAAALGLARVLARQERWDEAIAALDMVPEPADAAVLEARRDIEARRTNG